MAREVQAIPSVHLSAVALAAVLAELTCALHVRRPAMALGMHAMALGMLMTEHLLQSHGQQQRQQQSQQQKLAAFLMQ